MHAYRNVSIRLAAADLQPVARWKSIRKGPSHEGAAAMYVYRNESQGRRLHEGSNPGLPCVCLGRRKLLGFLYYQRGWQ
jgi:hypothetical protein